ncbi:hypothetical protein CIL03_01740 [Virgibacillus indicus]|uniref:FHA domain-containing protein n=1 Tax=Virgibacillus indicus TaxID=2024554 RepID=A0A265NDJ3_9BACI|nr:DUF6382 domain-containing protein [Virgibacillus indicus]OZU89887.1 hypothetical protein CIL03_01740 [Virgibacillus indicus]
MGTIYNLNYDYSHQNGHSIIFNKKNDEELTSEDLNAVQLKMMQSNKIPHLLKMSVEDMDLTSKLHYDITSKRKLISYFRDNSTSMNDYYQLFLSIITTLENTGSYMLDQQNFIIKQEFIYIGEHAGDVYLTYLPVANLEKDTDVTEDFKKLLTDVAGEVEGLQGNEFKSILNYIKNTAFSFSGLKKLLLELIALRSNVNIPNEQYGFGNGPYNSVNNYNMPVQAANPYVRQNQQPAHSQEKASEIQPAETQKSKKKLPPLSSREKVYMFAGSLLALAMVWKLFDINPSRAMLLVSGFLSVVIIAALVVYWRVWRPGVKPVETELEKEKDADHKPTETQKRPVQTPNPQFNQNYSFQAPDQGNPAYSNVAPFPSQNSAAAATLAVDTTLLADNSEDTVLLEDEGNLSFAKKDSKAEVLAVLLKSTPEGQTERIDIDANNFLIGRNTESVNYTEEAVGVSRIHVEIIKIDGSSYGLKDLGSKNGSKLNGNAMVPYKIYALNEDDSFELGKASYTFKWSNS